MFAACCAPDSPDVLRFTGFDHRRERRRLEYAFLTNAAATVRSCGSGVSVRACEGVRPRASHKVEWSTMAVPTYPEGVSHALKVCQHHHQVVRVGPALSGCQRVVRDSRNTLLATLTAPADSAETLTVTQRTARSMLP